MQKHYVCPVCKGVSHEAKNCGTEGCPLQGRPLVECTCQDNSHPVVQPK